MKRSGLLFVLLLAPCILIACSYILDATLFNNTGEAVDVSWGGKSVTITANRLAEIHYPVGTLRLAIQIPSTGCEYIYDVPHRIDDYRPDPKLNRGVQIQVEKDFSINLLPESYVGEVPASSEMVLQQEGFPLRPVARKCH
ncbi:MAG TPA: hypothetical protein VJS47_00470 [Rhizomicrobium sp.]|nr:hypothetical protein [Rhizomicrobium sp.]